MNGLLAARSGQLLNASEIGQHAGIKGSTVQEWISLLADELTAIATSS